MPNDTPTTELRLKTALDALRIIAEFPITDECNQDIKNMKMIARWWLNTFGEP